MENVKLYAELLAKLRSQLTILPDKPEETPESCLKALWRKAGGMAVSLALAMSPGFDSPDLLDGLDEEEQERLQELVKARLAGTPVAYLTGRQRFMGLEFIATPQAVIPRNDTELLCNALVTYLRESPTLLAQGLVIDIFTGSGNIPLSLAKLAPGPRYYGSDLSADAIDLARQNAVHLRLASACTFFCGDLLAPFDTDSFRGKVDIISGAPPFISSSKVSTMPREISHFEPASAFDAGPFGVSLYLRLISEAPAYLKFGGWLFMEVGLGQGTWVLRRLSEHPLYCKAKPICDVNGNIHAVAAQRKPHLTL